MENSLLIGIISLVTMIVVHAAVLFYWGGKVSKAILLLEKIADDHEERIRALEHAL